MGLGWRPLLIAYFGRVSLHLTRSHGHWHSRAVGELVVLGEWALEHAVILACEVKVERISHISRLDL